MSDNANEARSSKNGSQQSQSRNIKQQFAKSNKINFLAMPPKYTSPSLTTTNASINTKLVNKEFERAYSQNLNNDQSNSSKISLKQKFKNEQLNTHFRNVSNCDKIVSAQSWDSMHMSRFLKKNDFSHPITQKINKSLNNDDSIVTPVLNMDLNYDYSQSNILPSIIKYQENDKMHHQSSFILIDSNRQQKQMRHSQDQSPVHQQLGREKLQQQQLLLELQQTYNASQMDKQKSLQQKQFDDIQFRLQIQQKKTLQEQIRRFQKEKEIKSTRSIYFTGPNRFLEGSIYKPLGQTANLLLPLNHLVISDPQYYESLARPNANQSARNVSFGHVTDVSIPKKNFALEKMDFNSQPYTSGHNMRNQLKDVKTEQAQYKVWKEDAMQKVKKYRIIKNQYKSGILNFDSPFNPKSQLYKEEHHKYNKSIAVASLQGHPSPAKNFYMLNQTDQNIQFFNKSNISDTNHQVQIFDQRQVPLQKLHAGQIQKKYRFQDTQKSVFGGNPRTFNLERANFLNKQQTGGKKYQIISNSTNDLQYMNHFMSKQDPSYLVCHDPFC